MARLPGKLKLFTFGGDADALPAGFVPEQLHQPFGLHPFQASDEGFPFLGHG